MKLQLLLTTLALSSGSAFAAQIADGTWTLTQLTDATGTLNTAGPEAPTLRLLGTSFSTAEGTLVSGNTGCNTFKTTALFTAKTLRLRPIATTKMACPELKMALEQRYLKILTGARVFSRQGNTLTLTSRRAKVVFIFGTYGQRQLLTQWRLVGGQGETPLTLTFGSDGRVTGSSGCNTFMGQYSVDDTMLSIGSLGSTRRACPDADLQAQEQTYLQDLQGVRSFQSAGSMLTLTTKNGKTLTFARPVN